MTAKTSFVPASMAQGAKLPYYASNNAKCSVQYRVETGNCKGANLHLSKLLPCPWPKQSNSVVLGTVHQHNDHRQQSLLQRPLLLAQFK